MLKTRVVTAVLLLAALLPALFLLPQSAWALLMALVAGLAGWEWAALARLAPLGRVVYGTGVVLVCGVIQSLFPVLIDGPSQSWTGNSALLGLYGLALAFWLGVAPFWLARRWPLGAAGVAYPLGFLILVPTWLAMVQLRVAGAMALLAILAVVWVADVAAYFSGKTFGKHKLAPAISPGKTWEGAVGAVLAVQAYGWVMLRVFALDVAWPLWSLGLLLVTVVSIVGDLYESLLKRQVGLKDSSHILPGHGGVLDRIDSLTSTLPAIACLWLLFPLDPV